MKNALFSIFVVMICVVLCLTFFRVVYTGDTTQYIPSQSILQSLQDFNSAIIDDPNTNIFFLFTSGLRSILDSVAGFTEYYIQVATADNIVAKVLAVLEALAKSFEHWFKLLYDIVRSVFYIFRAVVLIFIDFLKLLDTILGVGAFVPWQS